jgi:hypothetical protein
MKLNFGKSALLNEEQANANLAVNLDVCSGK